MVSPFSKYKSLRVPAFSQIGIQCRHLVVMFGSILFILVSVLASDQIFGWTAPPSSPPTEQDILSFSSSNAPLRAPPPFPFTRMLSHVGGHSFIENLYLYNGQYIWYRDPEDDKNTTEDDKNTTNGMTVSLSMETSLRTKLNIHDKSPDLTEMGRLPSRLMEGFSCILQDRDLEFNYYHFIGETLAGMWITMYAAALKSTNSFSFSFLRTLPDILPAQRMLFPASHPTKIQEESNHNRRQSILNAIFPGIDIQLKSDWDRLIESGMLYRFEYVYLFDRDAKNLHSSSDSSPVRSCGGACEISYHYRDLLPVNYWEPFREKVISAALATAATPRTGKRLQKKYRITLISPRVLPSFNQQSLENSIQRLQAYTKDRSDIDFRVMKIEDETLPDIDQIAIASETNILIGMHGPALTHALWMPPRSTIIEFYPETYQNLPPPFYALLAVIANFNHYGLWAKTWSKIVRYDLGFPDVRTDDEIQSVCIGYNESIYKKQVDDQRIDIDLLLKVIERAQHPTSTRTSVCPGSYSSDTHHDDPDCDATQAYLFSNGSWCANTPLGRRPYLQIDLGFVQGTTAISTQGRPQWDHWVSNYTLEYSVDGANFSFLGNFSGNSDRNTVVTHQFSSVVWARSFRIYPLRYNGLAAMRACMKTAPKCLGTYSATTEHWDPMCPASHGFLFSSGAWCAYSHNSDQALSVDLGAIYSISSISTQGRPNRDQWISRYHVLYSRDRLEYFHLGNFSGNKDRHTVVTNEFTPILARFVIIETLEWNQYVSMRACIGIDDLPVAEKGKPLCLRT